MPQLDRTGPEKKGTKTGRGLGKCKKASNDESIEKLGTGMGLRRKSSGGIGKGRRLKSNLK